MSNILTYIVYVPSYDENSGGNMFMHGLARELQALGQHVCIYPMEPPFRRPSLFKRLRRRLRPDRFRQMPGSSIPMARQQDLHSKTAVAIYPEITLGNPLKMQNVVRWLLFTPGKLNPFEFGPDEMFFCAGEMSDIPELTGGAPLLTLWIINPVYRNEERADRQGVCYAVRKGRAKPRLPQTEDPSAICIDGKSHAEINDIFNRCQTFISYDEATMYSQYAALCGCDSIVIPGMYDTRTDWTAEHPLGRFGVAYGLDDLDHARATRHKVVELLREEEAQGRESVRRFVERTHARFAPTA